jgi:hypothetical protein
MMTWLKTGQEFPLEAAGVGLSDAAYRTHHEALCWVMFRESGPKITERDVLRFAESADFERAVKELVDVGFWKAIPGGYQIVHSMEHQPLPKEIKQQRRDAAARQAKYRAKQAAKRAEERGNHESK